MNDREPTVFLTAEWRHLAMLNYEVDPRLLAPFVPAGTTLDCWNGKALVSLVGFRFLKTQVLGIPFPFHRNFDEVNLRFYVRREDGPSFKRGVVFIREIVPRWLIAAVASRFYNEHYIALPMSHDIRISDAAAQVEYRWKFNGNWNRLTLKADSGPVLPQRNSEQEFITEHYWGYAAQPDGSCVEYQVQHPQWKTWTAREARFEGCADELYGREFGTVLKGPPTSAFLAEGSAVSVYRGLRLPTNGGQ
jgi:uncharacterized protein